MCSNYLQFFELCKAFDHPIFLQMQNSFGFDDFTAETEDINFRLSDHSYSFEVYNVFKTQMFNRINVM